MTYGRNTLGKKKLFKRHPDQFPIDQKIKSFRFPIRISWSKPATKFENVWEIQIHVANKKFISNKKQIYWIKSTVRLQEFLFLPISRTNTDRGNGKTEIKSKNMKACFWESTRLEKIVDYGGKAHACESRGYGDGSSGNFKRRLELRDEPDLDPLRSLSCISIYVHLYLFLTESKNTTTERNGE